MKRKHLIFGLILLIIIYIIIKLFNLKIDFETTVLPVAAAVIFLVTLYNYFSKRTFMYVLVSLFVPALTILICYILKPRPVVFLGVLIMVLFASLIIYNLGLFKMTKEFFDSIKNKKGTKN